MSFLLRCSLLLQQLIKDLSSSDNSVLANRTSAVTHMQFTWTRLMPLGNLTVHSSAVNYRTIALVSFQCKINLAWCGPCRITPLEVISALGSPVLWPGFLLCTSTSFSVNCESTWTKSWGDTSKYYRTNILWFFNTCELLVDHSLYIQLALSCSP